MSYVVANNNSVKKSIGVDLFEDTISRYNADHLTVRRSYENIQKNNEGGNQVFLVKGSSQEENTKHTLVREMGNLEVDLMFIDADHEYAGVMKDLRIWTPLVRQGGMLVLDD
jgi:cephalosporin hydroxylase